MQHICLLSNLASQPHKASPRDQKNSLTSYFMLGINTWPWNWTLRRKNFWSRSWGDLHTYPSRSANTTWIGGRARSRYRESKQPFQVNYLYSLKEQNMWGVCSGFIEWGGESWVGNLFLFCEVRVNYSTLSFNLNYFFLLTGFTTYSLGGHPSAFPSPLPPCLPLWLWTDLHKLSLSVFSGWDSFTQRHTILTL